MIIPLEEAKKLWEDKTDEEIKRELLAIEVMIRNKTNNKFHDTRVRFKGTAKFKGNKIYGPFKDLLFRLGDRIEVSKSILNEGLFDITDITDEYIVIDEELEDLETDALITKVKYPEDIRKGIVDLIRFDLNMADKVGIKSETISRYSVQYFDVGKKENVEGYPISLMEFIKKYRKIRWS